MASPEAGCEETVEASGAGRWGDHPVRFTSSTVRRTWVARRGSEVRTVQRARLAFQLDGHASDVREFDSPNERDAFLSRSIVDRVETGIVPGQRLRCPDWGEALVGDELAGVTFVMDYLQLQFQGGVATLYVWPEVHRTGGVLVVGDTGYRDGLCGLIGDRVTAAGIFLDDGAVIAFKGGELVIPPAAIRDAAQPEVFEGHGGEILAAEPPFA